VTELEAVQALYIRKFLLMMSNKGRKPQYVNDLLKAYKCYFKYAYSENYIDVLITERIKNIKQPKTVIKTFATREVKKMVEFYNGNDFLSIRNKAIISIFFDTGGLPPIFGPV
jgi:integrase/recombinase XerD